MIKASDMTIRIYVRASTKDQDAERALSDLVSFSQSYGDQYSTYIENYSGTKLERPALNHLLAEANKGDILLVESVKYLLQNKNHLFTKEYYLNLFRLKK